MSMAVLDDTYGNLIQLFRNYGCFAAT